MKTYIYGDVFEAVTRDGKVIKLPINTIKESGCCVQHLQSMFSQIEAMLSWHSKVLMIVFEVHMKVFTPDNKAFSRFLEQAEKRIFRFYKREFDIKLNRMGLCWGREIHLDKEQQKIFVASEWAREQEKAKKQHYHVIMLLDGDSVQSYWNVSQIIKEMIEADCRKDIFASHWIEHEPVMIYRNNRESLEKAFYWASYAAKERGKGYRAKTANDFSVSKVPYRPKPIRKAKKAKPIDDRPQFELTMCEQPQSRPQRQKQNRITTKRVKQQAVNDAQLELDLMIA